MVAVRRFASVGVVLPRSGGAFSLVLIAGQNLSGATAVTFGGHGALYLPVSKSLVLALAPRVVSGTVDVQVTTPAGTSPTSSADTFRYTRR